MELLNQIGEILAILAFISLGVIGCIWVFTLIRWMQGRDVPRWASFRNLKIYFWSCMAFALLFPGTLDAISHFEENQWPTLPHRILHIAFRPFLAFVVFYAYVYKDIKSRRSAIAAHSDRNTEQKESFGHDHDTNDRGIFRWLLR
ncbi:MAG TPA: hypothetical protein PLG59_03990 [bacterium]|nr:hypothetical protein [bacterium]HQO33796.1 hypothetical protein [bacterium]